MEHFIALAPAPMFIHEGVDGLHVTHVEKFARRMRTTPHRLEGLDTQKGLHNR